MKKTWRRRRKNELLRRWKTKTTRLSKNKLKEDCEEKINFNSLDDNEEALFDPLYKSPQRNKPPEEVNPDDTAQEVMYPTKRKTGASLKQTVEDNDCMNVDTANGECELAGPKRASNKTDELLDTFANEGYESYLFGQDRRRDSSIEQTKEIAHSYIQGLLKF